MTGTIGHGAARHAGYRRQGDGGRPFPTMKKSQGTRERDGGREQGERQREIGGGARTGPSVIIMLLQTSVDGNTTTSVLSFMATKADAGRHLSCQAQNRIMGTAAIEDGWMLQIQCKLMNDASAFPLSFFHHPLPLLYLFLSLSCSLSYTSARSVLTSCLFGRRACRRLDFCDVLSEDRDSQTRRRRRSSSAPP